MAEDTQSTEAVEWRVGRTSQWLSEAVDYSYPLVMHGYQWINRRVETCEWAESGAFSIGQSVDFRLPFRGQESGDATVGAKREPRYLPLVFLPRDRAMTHFDCRDESGTALPMLERALNAQIAAGILTKHAGMLAEAAGSTGVLNEHFAYLVGRLVHARDLESEAEEESDAVTRVWAALAYRELTKPAGDWAVLAREKSFVRLAALLYVVAPVHFEVAVRADERRIIKLGWQSDVPHDRRGSSWRRKLSGQTTPASNISVCRDAGTHHFQISAPPGLAIQGADFGYVEPHTLAELGSAADLAGTTPTRQLLATVVPNRKAAEKGPTSRRHIYLENACAHRPSSVEPLEGVAVGQLSIDLEVNRPMVDIAMSFVAVFVALVLWLVCLATPHGIDETNAALAMLLLVPTLLAVVLIAPGEHLIASDVQRWRRGLVACSAVCALIGGLVLVFGSFASSDGASATEFLACLVARAEYAETFIGPVQAASELCGVPRGESTVGAGGVQPILVVAAIAATFTAIGVVMGAGPSIRRLRAPTE